MPRIQGADERRGPEGAQRGFHFATEGASADTTKMTTEQIAQRLQYFRKKCQVLPHLRRAAEGSRFQVAYDGKMAVCRCARCCSTWHP